MSKIYSINVTSLHTNKLGLARSFLAFATLSSFLFNDIEVLIFPNGFQNSVSKITVNSYTLLNLIGKEHIGLYSAISVLVLIWVISGYFPRYSCILHWYVTWSFFHTAALVDGGDQIALILTLLLVPICLTDTRKNHWQKAFFQPQENTIYIRNPFNYIFYFLIRLQVCVLYLDSSISKFDVEEWRNGTAVYYWLSQPIFGLPEYLQAITPLLDYSYIVVALTWGSIIIEILLFMGFFMAKSNRTYLLFLGICFHFSILIFHGLFTFFFAMAGALVLYLGNISQNFSLPLFRGKQEC